MSTVPMTRSRPRECGVLNACLIGVGGLIHYVGKTSPLSEFIVMCNLQKPAVGARFDAASRAHTEGTRAEPILADNGRCLCNIRGIVSKPRYL